MLKFTMPKENTHLHFAGDLLKAFLLEKIPDIDHSACLLGSVFPDVFFYLKPYKYISDCIHGVKGNASNEILLALFCRAKEQKDLSLFSFALGHLSHYCLDICLHPHVNAWVLEHSSKYSKQYYYFHILIETALDYRLNGIRAYQVNRAMLNHNLSLMGEVAHTLHVKRTAVLSAYRINIYSNVVFRIPFIRDVSRIVPTEILYGGLFYSKYAMNLEFDFSLFEKEMKNAALFFEEKMFYALKYWRDEIGLEELEEGIPDINLEEGLQYNREKLNENGIN